MVQPKPIMGMPSVWACEHWAVALLGSVLTLGKVSGAQPHCRPQVPCSRNKGFSLAHAIDCYPLSQEVFPCPISVGSIQAECTQRNLAPGKGRLEKIFLF